MGVGEKRELGFGHIGSLRKPATKVKSAPALKYVYNSLLLLRHNKTLCEAFYIFKILKQPLFFPILLMRKLRFVEGKCPAYIQYLKPRLNWSSFSFVRLYLQKSAEVGEEK